MENNEKNLIVKRLDLKEQFLREEISADEYSKLKNELEKELEELEQKEGKKENANKEYRHKVVSNKELKKNNWRFFSAILSIILLISIIINLSMYISLASTDIDKEVIAGNSVNYINANLLDGNTKASLINSEEKNGVYLLKLDINGKSFDSYATKDGNLLFTSAIDMKKPIDNLNINPEDNINSNAKSDISPDDDPSIGPANAPVTIIEFSDFQCPFCARAEPTVNQILSTYKDKVRLVYRDFPLSFHQYAQKSAEASECSDEQGKFWEYHDLLFEKQQEWSSIGITKMKDYAAQLNLDSKKFNDCLDSGKYSSEVQKDFEDGQKAGVSGTPAFFINGILISGAQPFENFKKVIDAELAE